MCNDNKETLEAKKVEFYAANVNAWLATKFEHDRSLLTLSAGGIGLLISFLPNVIGSAESLVIYSLALLAFIACLGTLLWIFRRNAKHLEDVAMGTATSDPTLSRLDSIAITSFILGVLFSSIIGISSAVRSYQEKESIVSKKESPLVNKDVTLESVCGISSFNPDSWVALSVDGISRMNPTNISTSTPSKPSPTPIAPIPAQNSSTDKK